MFRIFENWDGSFTVMPYEPGDDLITLGFGLLFLLMMGVVAGYTSLYMTLPMIAFFISILIDMYIHDPAGAFISYASAAYAWGGTCYAVMEATRIHGLGLLGLAGWLLMAIVAFIILVIPLSSRTETEILPFLSVIPLGMLWIGALLHGLADPENNYASTSAILCKYAFRVFGIGAAAGIAVVIFRFVKQAVRTGGFDQIVNDIMNLILGCLIIIGGCFLSDAVGSRVMTCYVIGTYTILSFLFRGRSRILLNEYAILPSALSLIMLPLSDGRTVGGLLPLRAADYIVSLGKIPFFQALAARYSTPITEVINWAFSNALRALVNLVLKVFDVSVPSFELPLLMIITVTFAVLCISASAGKFIRKK